MRESRRGTICSAVLGATLMLTMATAASAAPDDLGHSGPVAAPPSTEVEGGSAEYTNPIMQGVADAFSDPSVIRGKDGYWYAFATTTVMTRDNPGGFDNQHFMPIVRSADLHDWEYVGDVFSEDNHPSWVPFQGTYYWAPDVRYVDGQYYLYFSVAGTGDNSIGLATAPTPAGPWTATDGPVIDREPNHIVSEIDPALLVDTDGTKYLYYGSFRHGMYVVELTDDGTEAVGPATQVVSESRGEAAWVTVRDGYYYLFYSGLGCCAGVEGSYPVFVGRSTSPTGPFVDAEGVSLTDTYPGGTIVNSPNGNSLIGTGHNAIAVDRSGQDWFFSNAFYRFDTWGGRPTAMDRLDWIDGWPTVRAGAWTSDTPQPGPTGAWDLGSTFEVDGLQDWRSVRGAWHTGSDQDSGTFVAPRSRGPEPTFLLSEKSGSTDYRVEADLRVTDRDGRAGLVIAYRDRSNHVVAWLDPERGLQVVTTVDGRVQERAEAPVYDGFDFGSWHAVTAEVRHGHAAVQVTAAMQGQPAAQVEVEIPSGQRGATPVGVASTRGAAQADNVGSTTLYVPVTERVPDPQVGALLEDYSEEFDGPELAADWSWVNEPDGALSDGAFVWDTQDADLSGNGTEASVLLRDAPEGSYTVETKLHFPLGPELDNTHVQAGLIAYIDRPRSIHLAPAVVGTSRQALLWIGRDRNAWPEMGLGPSADTLWLRLRHTINADTGEHMYQAATSRDGDHWIWGGVWHLPGDDGPPRIGLVSMGGEGATATFDYVRFYGAT